MANESMNKVFIMDTDIHTPPANPSPLEIFVSTCEELGHLERDGASEEAKLVAKMYIAIALADIISPDSSDEDRANLIMLFMRDHIPPLERPEIPDTIVISDNEDSDPFEIGPA